MKWTLVPFSADADSLAGVLGGHIEMATTSIGSAAAQIKAGTIRPLALFADARNPTTSDVPTTTELGYKLPLARIMTVIAGPGGIPDDIQQTLTTAIKKATQTDAFKAFLTNNGLLEAQADEQTVDGIRGVMCDAADKYQAMLPTILAAQAAQQR